MRPLHGVVSGMRDLVLTLSLESGLIIKAPQVTPALRFGDKVIVTYDYTNNKIGKLSRPYKKDTPVEELSTFSSEEPEPEHFEINEASDSGALLPPWDWGFWNPVSGFWSSLPAI